MRASSSLSLLAPPPERLGELVGRLIQRGKVAYFVYFFFLFAFFEKGLFDRACSSEEVNLLIHDELQPDEGFHSLYDKAIDSLEKKLRKVLPNTFYGIHSFIEVSGETALQPPN